MDKVDKVGYVPRMAGSVASGNRSSSRVRRIRRGAGASSDRVTRLSQLFIQRAARLPAEGLRILEAVLEDRNADAGAIAAAVAAVSEATALDLNGEGIGETASRQQGLKRLDALTIDDESIDWAQTELIGVGELAERFGLGRSTIDNWRRAHRALAFSRGLRNFVFPLAQFEGTRPIAGLDTVRAYLASDEEAWEWLVTANPRTDDAPPLDWLRENRIDEVARAAEGAFDYA